MTPVGPVFSTLNMSAATKSVDLGTLHDVSRRRRSVSPLEGFVTASVPKVVAASNEESEAESLIAILVDALEAIAEGNSDASARSVARDALSTFHGR